MPHTVGARTGFTTTEWPAKIGVDPGRIWIVVTPFDSARSNAMSCALTAVSIQVSALFGDATSETSDASRSIEVSGRTRSEERRGGKEGGSTGKSRGSA